MKKFISMVMAAAMVATLVPATAFAKGDVSATAKVIDALDEDKDFDGKVDGVHDEVPELQLKITKADYTKTTDGKAPEMDVTVTLDNADFDKAKDAEDLVGIRYDDADISGDATAAVAKAEKALKDAKDELKKAQDAATAPADVAGRLKVAKQEQAKADTAHDNAVKAEETAKANYDKAVEAEETAKKDYYTAVNNNAGDVDDKKTAWDNAKADLTTKTEAYDVAKEATANALKAKEAADKEVKAAQDAYDAAVAEDATVKEKEAAVKKAEKALEDAKNSAAVSNVTFKDVKFTDDDEMEFTIVGELNVDDVVYVDLYSVMYKISEGKTAKVSVESDMVTTSDDLVYVSILDQGLTASIKKVAEVGEEEKTKLEKDLKIESNVGDFVKGQVIELKLSSGFEFVTLKNGTDYDVVSDEIKGEDKVQIKVNKDGLDEITIKADDMEIDAADAKIDAECKLTVKAIKEDGVGFSKTADPVVIAKVVEAKVVVSVDEDEDLPVIYSGVNVENVGITDDSDHISLKVTIEEPVVGSMDEKKPLTLTLPEGVYVTDVNVTDVDAWFDSADQAEVAFKDAYKKGEYDTFEFAKRVLAETDEDSEDTGKLEFELTLVAEPDYTGEVTLKVEGAGLEKAEEVKIAKFVAPFTVEAEKNDLIIDYRNTKVPTNIVVKEAEAGLWDEDLKFTFSIDKFEDDAFENDATYKVDDKSDMEVKAAKNGLGFTVEETSDEAAVITISDISLYMSRSLAAGAYDLEALTNAALFMYVEPLFTKEETDMDKAGVSEVIGNEDLEDTFKDGGKTYRVADAADFVDDSKLDIDAPTVKEGFVNIITAGRDQDDASFTKKVVVPVGEKYIMAGEEKIDLDVPAYVSAAGYTMLPVRAVATALGIKNDNVLWNQETRTVTILYGQRIITMSAGEKVVYVNGSAIPAAAKVEIKDNRTFLPMRDLATALGVTDITWDAATKTATLNGNQK